MSFRVVFRHNDELQTTSPVIGKEDVAVGLYQQACNDLHNAVIAETANSGYVQLWFNERILKEYYLQAIVEVDAPKPIIDTPMLHNPLIGGV